VETPPADGTTNIDRLEAVQTSTACHRVIGERTSGNPCSLMGIIVRARDGWKRAAAKQRWKKVRGKARTPRRASCPDERLSAVQPDGTKFGLFLAEG
jgi:hypothetical protein